MDDRGKNMNSDEIASFQAAAWKELLAALDTNPHALFLFDGNLRLMALNASARHLAIRINETQIAAGNLLWMRFHRRRIRNC